MACWCRKNRNPRTSMNISDFSAVSVTGSIADTIDLPGSLASATVGKTPISGLSSRDCLQRRFCSPHCCPCLVRQRLSLSGALSGLSSVEDLSVPYTIEDMPGIAVTDAAGRYSIDAYQGENVVITAPSFAGYMVTPEKYTLSPACFSRQDLDFRYTPLVFSVSLASQTLPPYTLAPNVWPLGGGTGERLIMLERILVTIPGTPAVVKYAPGVHHEAYFLTGGVDITATWATGIPVEADGPYTVYARLASGSTELGVIHVEGMRVGSEARPWLLLDFDTALSLEAEIPSIERFTLLYMQGGGDKLSQYYELYQDIDMAGRAWLPLGEIVPGFPVVFHAMFTGGLNGNGHAIDNLSPSNANGSVKALFACLGGGASIQNLALNHYHAETRGVVEEEGFYEIYGGFAAAANITDGRAVTFDHCSINGDLSSYAIFGLAAFISYATGVTGPVSITHCEVSMTISGANETGGFVGYFSGNGQGSLHFADCVTAGSVSGSQQIGGYVGGWNTNGAIVNQVIRCVNQMQVQASSFYAGGFVGTAYAANNTQFQFSSCYNAGNVTGHDQAGGIFGRIGGGSTTVVALQLEDCYNTGAVAGQLGNFSDAGAGGIVGLTQGLSTILRCYCTGTVQMGGNIGTNSYVGGIAGSYSILENCVALGQSVSGDMPLVGRVAAGPGQAPTALLSANLAFSGMQVLIAGAPKNPLEEGANLPDGDGRSAENLKTQATYQTELGWDFESTWQFGNGAYGLPVLRGIPLALQPQALPSFLA